jgi:hypothetical protein
VCDIVMDIVKLVLEYERFEESKESLGSTTDRHIIDCQIVEEESTYQRQLVCLFTYFILSS